MHLISASVDVIYEHLGMILFLEKKNQQKLSKINGFALITMKPF